MFRGPQKKKLVFFNVIFHNVPATTSKTYRVVQTSKDPPLIVEVLIKFPEGSDLVVNEQFFWSP